MSESSERGPAAVTQEDYRRIKKSRKIVGVIPRILAALGLAAATAGGAVATGKIIEKTGELQPGEVLAKDVAARYRASRAPVEVNIPNPSPTPPLWERPAVTPTPSNPQLSKHMLGKNPK